MNVATFKDLAAGIQSVLFSTAIVIGGVWTAFVFMETRPDKKAEYELFSQAVLNVTVEAKQLDMDDKGGLYIGAIAKLENAGNHATHINFKGKPPFRVSKIHFSAGAYGSGSRAETFGAINVTGVGESIISSHGSDQFHAFVRVPGPGYYYVEFAAPRDRTDLAATEQKLMAEIDADLAATEEEIKAIAKKREEGFFDWWGATSVMVEPRPPGPLGAVRPQSQN